MRTLLLAVILLCAQRVFACHGLALMNVQVTTNSTHILINANSDPASCGCGPYYMQCEVSLTGTFTGATPGNNSSSWNSFPWFRSLLDIPGYSAPNWNDQCVIEPYDTIMIPANMFCPGSTIYLRLREYVEFSASPGPWVTYPVTVPGGPQPLAGFAFTTDSLNCGVDTTTLTVVHNGCSGNYTASWNPPTGLSNPNGISTLAYPSVTTTYTLTFTDNSNSQSFVSPITIYVYTNTPYASATGTVASCTSNDASITATVSGGNPPLSNLWLPTYDTSLTVIGVGPGTYQFITTDAVGCADTVDLIVGDSCDLVWPGDCNDNGIVDMIDFLDLGLVYGSTGGARINPTINWVGQPAPYWVGNLPSSTVNLRWSDCNGDGISDADDTTAILQNFGMTHTNRLMNPPLQVAPTLYIDCVPDSTAPLWYGAIQVDLGDATVQADSVYGITFTLNYDEQYIDPATIAVNANTSWLGTVGNDLMVVKKTITGSGQTYIGAVRTNQTDAAGFGTILTITYGTTAALVGSGQSVYTPFTVTGITCITNQQIPLAVNPDTDTLVISDVLTSTPEQQSGLIGVFPNPANNMLNVQFATAGERTIELFNASGQVVSVWNSKSSSVQLDLSQFTAGLYYLQVDSGNGVAGRRIVISR